MTNDFDNKDTHNSSLDDTIHRNLESLREEHNSRSEDRQVGDLLKELGLRGGQTEEKPVDSPVLDKIFFDENTAEEVAEDSVSKEVEDLTSMPEEATPLSVETFSAQAEEELVEAEVSETPQMSEEAVADVEGAPIPEALVTRFAQEEASEFPSQVETTLPEESTEVPDLDATRVHQNLAASSQKNAKQVALEDTIIADKEKSEVPVPRRRRSDLKKRKKQDTAAKRIVSTVVLVVLFALAVTGVAGYSYVKSSLDPINSKATDFIQVEIPRGSTTHEIGQILVKKKLIKNATIFNYYAKLKSYNNFQSGFYNLSQNMSVDDLAKALQESGTPTAQKPVAGKVLVVEGLTLEQIAKSVTDNVKTEKKDDKTPFKEEDFLATVKNPDFIKRMVAAYPKLFSSLPEANSGVKYQLEGYLFPATYEYSSDMTTEQLAEKMIATMDAKLQPYYDQLAAKNLTVNELLTLASLVEKEGSTDEDRRNIAAVFYNRLNANMPLQSNIAILYAMGKLGQKTTLKEDTTIDTNINSPYNIYVKTGLMPGPVDNPSLAAIDATLNQTKNNYLYFVADVTTGNVYFSTTLEEHNQKVEQYVNKKVNQ